MEMEQDDLAQLKRARTLLDNPGFAVKLQNALGRPVAAGFRMLPARINLMIQKGTETALRRAMMVAVRSLQRTKAGPPRNRRHKALVAFSGGVGGFFGVAGVVLELPVTTTIIMRSIAEIAREEGEDLADPQTQIHCLEVLGLGGEAPKNGKGSEAAIESGYYFTRAVLAREVSEAARYVAERGLSEEGAPVIVRLVASVAARFGIVVSEKAAAAMIPLVGGAAGALVNHIFIDHFQHVARGHFTVRRLERKYGREAVETAYRNLNSNH